MFEIYQIIKTNNKIKNKMKEKVFVEIGFGNNSFFSTEIEKGRKEYRVNKLMRPKKINGIYLRFWVFKTVFCISSYDGLTFKKKNKNKFKILFGIEGFN